MRLFPLRLPAALAAAVALTAGCSNPGRDSGDDTVDSEDSEDSEDTDEPVETDDTQDDTDTDPPESGWGGETGETGAEQPADSAPVDSGTPPNPNDTSVCPFGETADCTGTCYPSYLVGDRTCDDGIATPSNFNCVEHDFDGGDCGDTDPPTPPSGDPCPWIVQITPSWPPGDVGWTLTDVFDRPIYFVTPGTYLDGNRIHDHHVDLPTGDYVMVMEDASNDGWDSAQYKVIDPRSGDVVSRGSFDRGASAEQNFSLVCEEETDAPEETDVEPKECGDLRITVFTSTNAFQVGWQMREADGTLMFDIAPGQYQNNRTYTYDVPFPSGRYDVVMFDEGNNGWQGGSIRVEDASTGDILLEGALMEGRSRRLSFAVDCSDTFNPAPTDPADLNLTCDPVYMLVHTGPEPADIAWEVRDAVSQALIASKPVGSYRQADVTVTETLPIRASGDYVVRLVDDANNGWDGGFVQIVDDAGWVFASGGQDFTNGFEHEVAFTTVCPPLPPDPPEPVGCVPGTVIDCNGVCWPPGYQGDGFCDDGTTFAPNYFCAAGNWDGGDCGAPLLNP